MTGPGFGSLPRLPDYKLDPPEWAEDVTEDSLLDAAHDAAEARYDAEKEDD